MEYGWIWNRIHMEPQCWSCWWSSSCGCAHLLDSSQNPHHLLRSICVDAPGYGHALCQNAVGMFLHLRNHDPQKWSSHSIMFGHSSSKNTRPVPIINSARLFVEATLSTNDFPSCCRKFQLDLRPGMSRSSSHGFQVENSSPGLRDNSIRWWICPCSSWSPFDKTLQCCFKL